MTWFLLAVGAAVFWAIGHILVKKGFENIPPLWNNIFGGALSCFIHALPALLLSNFRITVPPLQTGVVILFSASLYLTFYYAISKGRVSLTGTIVAGYPVTTIILSHIFLAERLSHIQIVGVSSIIAGVVSVALPEKHPTRGEKDMSWILWGGATSLTIGSGDFLAKLAVNRIGSYSYILFMSMLSNLLSIANYLIDKRARPVPKLHGNRLIHTFAGLVMMLTGTLLFFLAFGYGKASLVTPVSSIYPAIVLILAVRFLNEKVSMKQGAGIAVTVIGLIITGLAEHI